MLTLSGKKLTLKEVSRMCNSGFHVDFVMKRRDGKNISGSIWTEGGLVVFSEKGRGKDVILCGNFLKENVESIAFLTPL